MGPIGSVKIFGLKSWDSDVSAQFTSFDAAPSYTHSSGTCWASKKKTSDINFAYV